MTYQAPSASGPVPMTYQAPSASGPVPVPVRRYVKSPNWEQDRI